MKEGKLFTFLTMFAIVLCFFVTAFANSAEPPCFTVIVSNAPDDLELYLVVDRYDIDQKLSVQKKGWETYYRYYYHMNPGAYDLTGDMHIRAESEEFNFTCPLMDLTGGSGYNALMTLDLKTEELSYGQSALRVPLLVTLRVVSTLIIEGAVFCLLGYRQKRSFIAFFIINLITQGFVNAMITGPGTGYYLLGYLFLEILVLITEMIAFPIAVPEKGRGYAVMYAVFANIASLVIGGLMISYLPI